MVFGTPRSQGGMLVSIELRGFNDHLSMDSEGLRVGGVEQHLEETRGRWSSGERRGFIIKKLSRAGEVGWS